MPFRIQREQCVISRLIASKPEKHKYTKVLFNRRVTDFKQAKAKHFDFSGLYNLLADLVCKIASTMLGSHVTNQPYNWASNIRRAIQRTLLFDLQQLQNKDIRLNYLKCQAMFSSFSLADATAIN